MTTEAPRRRLRAESAKSTVRAMAYEEAIEACKSIDFEAEYLT